MNNGDTFSAAGFEVSVVGEEHHLSHPDFPPVDNIVSVVDDEVFHPGDALTILDATTLLAPVQAPWMIALDLFPYLREIRPICAWLCPDSCANSTSVLICKWWPWYLGIIRKLEPQGGRP